MVPLDDRGAAAVLGWDDRGPGRRPLAIRHALLLRRYHVLADHPTMPSSVVLVHDGGGQWDAFGAGRAEPALGWLVARARRRPLALLAPESWGPALEVATAGREVGRGAVETWTLGGPPPRARSPVAVRRLTIDDTHRPRSPFPDWAWPPWKYTAPLFDRGAAFGVPHGDGFAALAWIYEADDQFDAVAVHTLPPYRRLGLGRAAASALVAHIVADRHRRPCWVAAAERADSLALARSLGFAPAATEPLVRFGPGP